MQAISLLIAALGSDYYGGRIWPGDVRQVRVALSNKEVKVLVRQFAKNVRQLRRILFKEGLFQQMLGLEISLLNQGDCETLQTQLAAVYSVMESNSLNTLILSTYSIKFSLLENIEALLASKFSFRFWRMLPVWLKNVERMMYGYEMIGAAGKSNKYLIYNFSNKYF